jgi:HEAT repeat protein
MVVGTDASLPTLARMLKDDETVGIACLALSSRRSPKVSEVLRSTLPSSRGRARVQIIGALGNHQDIQSIGTLTELARDADAAVADAAILALGKMGSAAAHAAIAALRKEARPAQLCAVTDATCRVAEQLAAAGDCQAASALYTQLLQPKTPSQVRRGALAALLQLDKDGGEQRIVKTLSDRDPVLTPVAIARISLLKSEGASKTFAAMLPNLSPSARGWMIEALASRGDAVARSAIRDEVLATDEGVRRAAILAVGKLDDTSAVGMLMQTLAGAKSPGELQDIEHALTLLRGGAATDQALVAQLRQSSADAKVRLFNVLVRRGARVAVPALLKEASGSDTMTVQAAFLSLGKLAVAGDLPALLEKLVNLKASDARADAERAAARTIGKIVDISNRAEPVCALLAKTTDIDARCSLLRLLPRTGDPKALAVLVAADREKDPRIRDASVRALATWPDTTGWNALLTIYRRPDNDTHRALALRSLTRLAGDLNAQPDARLMERYRQLLKGAQNDDERKLILSVLAGAAHPEALQLSLSLLSNPGIRAETELAVKKIAASVRAEHPQAAQDALRRLRQSKP